MSYEKEINQVDQELLSKIADLTGKPVGAFNIRKDSGCADRQNSENIEITNKTDKPGIDIRIKPGTKETCYIPVIITKSGLSEMVYNDFYIGEGADVEIMAGCGIHNCGSEESRHDGVHTFYVGKNARVKYSEKHYGDGDGTGGRVMNPETIVYLEEGATVQMDTIQIAGIDSTKRYTRFEVGAGAEVVVTERLLTHGEQSAISDMDIYLQGVDSKGRVISRSVAQDKSYQSFHPRMVGESLCFGHVQCDSIIMGEAKIASTPEIVANSTEAQLIHEAAIGKIAGDQLLKLQTLGLTEEEAEDRILKGFLA
ncbi:MAG: SufD family Fe-S cluster assembly protein [Oscillospiraceae bacterium]|nr:SufD family Fe-S cluster assembly protein [Oscillospiraceae bacterium]